MPGNEQEYKTSTASFWLILPQVQRGTLEEEAYDAALKTPDYPVYTVYLDESGKTSPRLIVGSLWFLSSGIESLELFKGSNELKERFNFDGEFHFAKLKKEELPIYKELVDLFVTKGGTLSFKFISVPKEGIRSAQLALADLYYHLLIKGIEHENSTGRAPVPRILQAWKDQEEVGSDKLLVVNLEDRLRQAATSIYGGKLVVEKNGIRAMDSKSSVFLQMADLIASSVNRILCRTNEDRNHKDEMADYLITRIGISADEGVEETVGDIAVHIKL